MSYGVVASQSTSGSSGTSFGTFAGTFLILGLIIATIVIFKMMSGSLKRMNANLAQHPEDFGRDEADDAGDTGGTGSGAPTP